MKRLLIVGALTLAVLAHAPGLALAHAELVSSNPADGAAIAWTNAPTSLSLTFSEDVGKDVTTVHVTRPDGSEMAAGAAQVDFDNGKLVTVALKALTPGPYTVKWHAVTTDDNGQTDGTFSFTIINNTGGTTGGGTTAGGTTGGTTSGGTLPQSGVPPVWPGALLLGALAGLLLSVGLLLRRARPAR